MISQKPKKVCIVLTNRVHYSRGYLLLEELRKSRGIELQLLVGGSAIIEKYGNIIQELKENDFKIDGKVTMQLEGTSPSVMSKSTGLGLIEFSSHFENLKPDIVLVRGDRYEVLAPVIAAAYQNIPIAHLEGGDVSGTIDELVRHSITKLSHIHFVTNSQSKERVIRLGEREDMVFDFGSLDAEILYSQNLELNAENFWEGNVKGVGSRPSLSNGYLLVMQHPVTTEYASASEQMKETIKAVEASNLPAIWIWPNIDAGSGQLSKELRNYREKNNNPNFHFFRYIETKMFGKLLNNSLCVVGNSSAGIKESSYLGIPAVNIGTRQDGRLRGDNVIDVGHVQNEILDAILKQVKNGRYEPSNIYHKPDTSKRIVDVLSKIVVKHQKRLTY